MKNDGRFKLQNFEMVHEAAIPRSYRSTLSGNTTNMFPWNIKGDNKKLQHIFSDIVSMGLYP